jgi:hypothetical protein
MNLHVVGIDLAGQLERGLTLLKGLSHALET